MKQAGGVHLRPWQAAAAAAATGALLLTGTHSAFAADPAPEPAASQAAASADDGQLTWSVTPVDKDNASRSLFEYNVEPGDVIKDTLRVRVIGSTEIGFQVYGSDAFLGESGVFDVLPAAKPSKDVGSWVEMGRDRLTIRGGDATEIPFTLTVPDNATPGDHVGGIVTSVGSTVDAGDGGNVRLDRRLGARIYLRVAGPLTPALTVSKPTVSYRGSANPVGGKTQISYTISNTGNTRLQAKRNVKVGGLLGGGTIKRDLPELLPGAVLSFTEILSGPRVLGPANAKVAVEPRDQLQGELPTSSFTAATSSGSAFAFAWSQLLLLLLFAGLVSAYLVNRKRTQDGADSADVDTQRAPAPTA